VHPYLRTRLGVQMFLSGAAIAVWTSVLAKHVEQIGFTPLQAALAVGTASMASIVTPLLGGQVADRWLSSERFLAVSNLGGGVLLLLGASQQGFLALGSTLLGAWLFFANVFPLGTALALQHLADPARQFPGVRVWGTIGWVAGALGLTGWLHLPGHGLGDSLWLAGLIAVANGFYSFTLPHTPPRRSGVGPSATGKVLSMLREPSFAIFMAIFFMQQVFAMFYVTNAAVFLPVVGVSPANLPVVIGIGQTAEIAMMWGLPLVYRRFGEKGTMALGMAAWVLRFGVFSLGGPAWLVIASIAFHGPGFAFVRIAATMYIDRICERDVRSSAQSLLAVVIDGASGVLGAVLAGLVSGHLAGHWRAFWIIPAIGGAVILAVFLAAFRPKATSGAPGPAPAPTSPTP